MPLPECLDVKRGYTTHYPLNCTPLRLRCCYSEMGRGFYSYRSMFCLLYNEVELAYNDITRCNPVCQGLSANLLKFALQYHK